MHSLGHRAALAVAPNPALHLPELSMTTRTGSMVPILAALIAVAVWPQHALAQSVRCSTRRGADGSYVGACARADSAVAQLTLRYPTASEPHLWRGTGTFTGGAPQALAVDLGEAGALVVGRQWLAVTRVTEDSLALEFVFSVDSAAPPSRVDAEILRRARA